MGSSSTTWYTPLASGCSAASTSALATSSTRTASHQLSPRPITAKRPGWRSRVTNSSSYQPPGPYTWLGRTIPYGSPDSATIRSPSCLECPYGVSTGSGLPGSSSSPFASPVTTVEQNTSFGSPPAALAASTSRRVPSTLVALILASLRCDAISAARWITHSGCASATADVS